MRLVCNLYDPAPAGSRSRVSTTDVIPPSRQEFERLGQLRLQRTLIQEAHHLKLMRTEDPLEVMKRIWGMPTFEVHGVVGGYQGPGVKSIVPPRAEVKASFRLVPVQDPEKIKKQLKAAVKELNPT